MLVTMLKWFMIFNLLIQSRSVTCCFPMVGRSVRHHCYYDFMHLKFLFSKPSLPLHVLLLRYIDKTWNQIAHNGNPKSDHWHHSSPPREIAPSTIILPLTNCIISILVMLVMSLLLLLLQGMGWPLQMMADHPKRRTAENRIQASLRATKLPKWMKEMSGGSFSSSGTYSPKFSSKLPRWLNGCAIAGSLPAEWNLPWIMLWILSIIFAWTSGKEESKSASRWRNTSVYLSSPAWLMFLVLRMLCAPALGPNSGGIIYCPSFEAHRQWRMEITLWAMNVGLISSIKDLSFIPICRMP